MIISQNATAPKQWLYTGHIPAIKYQSNDFLKNEMSDRPHELRTAGRLSTNGIQLSFSLDRKIDKTSSRHRTIGCADFMNGYEIKTPMQSKSAFGMVKNALDSTQKKEGVKRLVIDLYEAHYLDENLVINQIKEQSPDYQKINWISIINKQGLLVDVIKK